MRKTIISLLSIVYILGLYSIYIVESSHVPDTGSYSASTEHEKADSNLAMLYGAL